jgi:hypothetical protein
MIKDLDWRECYHVRLGYVCNVYVYIHMYIYIHIYMAVMKESHDKGFGLERVLSCPASLRV